MDEREDIAFEIIYKGRKAVVTYHNDNDFERYRLEWEDDASVDFLYIDRSYEFHPWRSKTVMHMDDAAALGKLIEEKV